MAGFIVKIVNALPETLTPNTWYIVKSSRAGFISSVITGKDNTDVYKFPSLETLTSTVTEMSSLKALPNKIPIGNENGQIDPTYFDILSSTSSAVLHQSPIPITAMFIYDTTKDSDGGAWTDKCQHTSWYNEPLCGKWLGQCATESAARGITGATTNDYYQLTANGRFYKLNAGSGITEVFRGNKANFPKIAGLVAQGSDCVFAIYDLTEPNYPMWMVFLQTVSTNALKDFIRNGRNITNIDALNGYVGLSLNVNGGFGLINFPQDIMEKPGSNNLANISKRGIPNLALLGRHGYPTYELGQGYFTNVKMLVLPNAIVENGLPRPTIILLNAVITGGPSTIIIHSNKTVVGSSTILPHDAVAANRQIILAGNTVGDSIYYMLSPNNLDVSFTVTTMLSAAPPYFNDAITAKLTQTTLSRYIMHGNQNSVRQLMANVNTYPRSLTTRTTNNEQTGWLVGDIRRCYMGNNLASAMLSNTLIPVISNAKLIQQLGSEAYVFSLLSLGNGIILAGTYPTGQIYRSTDNGLSFTLIQRLGSETFVYSLLSLGNGIILAGTEPTGQIYRSTDNGLSFTFIQRLGSETYVLSLLSLGNGVVLAGTGNTGQIYRSTDNGLSFTLVQQLSTATLVFKFIYLGNGVVLAGTGFTGQIYRSTDNGLSFTLVQQLGSESQVRPLLSLGNGIILAGTYPTGQIYRSTDNGLSFTLIQRLGSETYVLSLLSLGNGVVLAGTGNTGQIYRSIDNGLSFTLIQRLGSEYYALSLLSLGNGIVLAGTGSTGQVYRYTFPVITGTLTKTAVATNADLTAYSGFSNSNYVKEAYSSDLDFGTAEWSMSAWIKIPAANAAIGTILYRGHTGGPYIALTVTAANYLSATAYDGTTTRTVTSVNPYNLDTWIKVRANYRTDGSLSLSVNGVDEATTYGTPLLTLNNANAVLTLGNNYALDAPFPGSLCLVKLSATVPTPDQMAFMFAEESQLFRDNAQCTLPDASGIVDLAYDDETDTWTSVSATYKAEWNGLVRTKSSVLSAGAYTKIESRSGMALETITNALSEVRYSKIRKNLRGLLSPYMKTITDITLEYVGGFAATTTNGSTSITSISGMSIPQETTHYEAIITGTGIVTDTQLYNIVGTTGYISKPATANGTAVQIAFRDFILPPGYTAVEVSVAGSLKQEGASKDYTRLFDGFRETIRFGTAPGYNAWVSIQAIPLT